MKPKNGLIKKTKILKEIAKKNGYKHFFQMPIELQKNELEKLKTQK